MPNRDELLSELTFKGQVDDTTRRVFYTLCGYKASDGPTPAKRGVTPEEAQRWLHRVSVVVAGLVEKLEASGALRAEDLDEILLNAAQ